MSDWVRRWWLGCGWFGLCVVVCVGCVVWGRGVCWGVGGVGGLCGGLLVVGVGCVCWWGGWVVWGLCVSVGCAAVCVLGVVCWCYLAD